MRTTILAGLAAALVAGPALAAEKPEAELAAALARFVDLVDKGDVPAALAYYLPNASIMEDLAPYHWQGPKAGMDWLNGMASNAEAHGMSNVQMHVGAPTTVLVTGNRGYEVVPGELTYTFKNGDIRHAQGHITVAAERTEKGWQFEALTWAWEAAKEPRK